MRNINADSNVLTMEMALARNEGLKRLFSALDPIASLDLKSGAVSADFDKINAAIAQLAPSDVPQERLRKSLEALIRDGFEVNGKDALPRATLTEWLKPGSGIPAKVRARILKRFSHDSQDVPPSLEEEDALAAAADGLQAGASWNVFDFNRTVEALLSGEFSLHWWGWSVRYDNQAAGIIGDFFSHAGTWAGVAALGTALLGAPLPVAYALIGMSVILWVLGVLFSTYASAGWGACVQGNWPTPLLGALVWVVPA